MPTVCDFSVIQDGQARVTPGNDFTRQFNTGGRETSHALLLFNLRSNAEGRLTVQVNGHNVGNLEPYSGESPSNWYAQSIVFSGSRLKNGNNVLQIELERGDLFVKDVVCFFHQKA